MPEFNILNINDFGGINKDISTSKSQGKLFDYLDGLDTSRIVGEMTLGKKLSHAYTFDSGTVYADIYNSKDYGKCILFIDSSNFLHFYIISSGISSGLISLPSATDWSGVQIDTRYYLQSKSAMKRYIIRYDISENYVTEVNLETSISIIDTGYNYGWNGPDISAVNRIKACPIYNGIYGKVSEFVYKDDSLNGFKLIIYKPSNTNSISLFASGANSVIELEEDREFLTLDEDGIGKIRFLDKVKKIDGTTIGARFKGLLNPVSPFGFMMYLYSTGLTDIFTGSIDIDGTSYTISSVSYNDGSLQITVNEAVQLSNTDYEYKNISVEMQWSASGYIIIPLLVGSDTFILGDLISNITEEIDNLDAYGKAVAYAGGYLFLLSPKWSVEDYESFITYSYINNQGLRQALSFPITNILPIGTNVGTAIIGKTKFQRVYFFTTESIVIMNPNKGNPVIEDILPLPIASKYHIAEYKSGFYIISGEKIYHLGYNGLEQILGINSKLAQYIIDEGNLDNIYLSYNAIDNELIVSDGYDEKLYIYNINTKRWRSLNNAILTSIASFSYGGIPYFLNLGDVWKMSGYESSIEFYTEDVLISGFSKVSISDIRFIGDIVYTGNLTAKLYYKNESGNWQWVNLSLTHDKRNSTLIFSFRRDELTTRFRVFRLYLHCTGITNFHLYNIDLYGLFVKDIGESL